MKLHGVRSAVAAGGGDWRGSAWLKSRSARAAGCVPATDATGPASEAVEAAAASACRFVDRGETDLKGVPGRWHLYAISSSDKVE